MSEGWFMYAVLIKHYLANMKIECGWSKLYDFRHVKMISSEIKFPQHL